MPNRDVGVVTPEIDECHVRADVDIDVLVLRDEAAEPGQQPARRERRRDADAQLPRVAALARLAQCILDFGKRAAQPGREPLPLLRQPYAATCALDQAHVQRRLQRLDLVTDRAVREGERFRSARQALPARRRLEGAQCLHRGDVHWHPVGSQYVSAIHILVEY